MQITITIDDICDGVGALSIYTMDQLHTWYDRIRADDIDRVLEGELRSTIRDAIEGVTNIPPEHIIIDLK
jgi:hypothetical protein